MDKKAVIKWTVAILANLGALVAIFLTANPQLTKGITSKKDSLNQLAAARFVPSYSKSENPGLLSKVADGVNDHFAAEQRMREMRERKMTRQDTIAQRGKLPIHFLQKMIFEDRYKDLMELMDMQKTVKQKVDPDFNSEVYSERNWDSVNAIVTTGNLPGVYQLKPGMQVFGWHPYWMGSAYKSYNFSLLSTIAYYGAELDAPTGDITSTHGWETTGLFSAIGDNTCHVELAIINNGSDNNADFLSDTTAQQNLIYNIKGLLSKRGDGVCLDFENVPTAMRNNLTEFITLLHDTLDAATKRLLADSSSTRYFTGFSISLVLPCFDWTGAYDLKKLAPLVNRFVVTGYDYYGSFSTTTGPVAPLRSGLKWEAPNIESSVDAYLLKGVPPDKLLLDLPYYATRWHSLNTKGSSPAVEFLDFPLYRDLRNDLSLRAFVYDTTSVSACFTTTNQPLPTQYWFENSATLSEKYRWVLRNHLGGVGIWALGYDNGSPELWRALLDNFARNRLDEDTTYATQFPLAVHDTLPLPKDKEWGIVAANGHYLIFDNPYVLLYGALFVFALILLLQVLLDEQPFNELFSKRLLLFIASSMAGTAVVILIGLALWSKVPHREIYLLLLGIIGGYLLFRLTQRIVGKRERLP